MIYIKPFVAKYKNENYEVKTGSSLLVCTVQCVVTWIQKAREHRRWKVS